MCTANHSTETALVKEANDPRINADVSDISVLMLPDLTAAFDTTDHTILLNWPEHLVGLPGTVLNWFST